MPVARRAEVVPLPLERRLVEVALDVLDREGLEGLTLRRLARAAGVSHGAPLRHFRSLADLLAEVAGVGFRRLHEGVADAVASLPAALGPRERLLAAGRVYVEAAVAQPALFALMFRPEDLDRENASYVEHGTAAFEQIVDLVRALQETGWRADRETRHLAAAVWSSVHGLATLWSQGAFGLIPDASLDAILDIIHDMVLTDR